MTISQKDLPFVSVVMPVRNEEKAISRSLRAALNQDYPKELLEVVIADGMSDDQTRRVVSEIAAKDPRVRLVENSKRIMAPGFNAALEQARGDVIVMMGGHSEMAPDFVAVSTAALSEGNAKCVGGTIETICTTGVGRGIALAMTSTFGVGDCAFRTGTKERKYVDTVAFGVYTRDAFTLGGQLDEEFVRAQDCEFNYRLRKLGARILFVPEMRTKYFSRASLRTLWRQYYGYGFWKARIMQKHSRQMRPRHFVPAAFVAALLVSAILAPFSLLGKLLFVAVAGSYLVANLTATFLAARNRNWKLAPLLPLAFTILHVSYGFGFLCCLAKYWNSWGDRPSTQATTQAARATQS
jgi:glycosyltransferase involved in cell wall biosynthesis